MKALLPLFVVPVLFLLSCGTESPADPELEGYISFTHNGETVLFEKYSQDPWNNAVCRVDDQGSVTLTQVSGKRLNNDSAEEIVISVPYQQTGSWNENYRDPLLGSNGTSNALFIKSYYRDIYSRGEYNYRFMGVDFTITIDTYDEERGRITGTFEGTLLIHELNGDGQWVLKSPLTTTTIEEGKFDVKIFNYSD